MSNSTDMFLLIKTARAGQIKGDAATPAHIDEIVVHGWRWGMSANSDAASRGGGQGGVPTRRAHRPLIVEKGLDRASTSLMSVLCSNDRIKTMTLVFRAAAGEQVDYFTLTLTDAILMDIDYVGDHLGVTTERLTFTYKHVSAEYRIQDRLGRLTGGTSFDDDA